MAPRILVGRWSPSKSVTKRQLRAACGETGISPRPNWLHASHEELLASVAPALEKAGVLVTARLDKDPTFGGRVLYQTIARWGVRRAAIDAPPGHFSWDAQQGKFRASFPGARYAAARAAVEEAVRLAEQNAAVRREDIRNQLALAVLEFLPIAPFAPIGHIQPAGHTWVLAVDSYQFNCARRFLQLAGHPLLDLAELDGPIEGMRAVVARSLASTESRFGTRSGWVALARSSHNELLEALT